MKEGGTGYRVGKEHACRPNTEDLRSWFDIDFDSVAMTDPRCGEAGKRMRRSYRREQYRVSL